ncbi:uncharacterized protein LOC106164388 [Lingula anatina]|uniref:Uncharacterized protein LOC106164388 n=1 Tax=Lingula anatina TaxID=7574 RepID=A0A1S3IHJ7_LINAN|nr:uncharacterized protein LOC106164388 [Lingula anatina]|eukprot:XP_013397735.1 uncharacterized protein LOC106164388 [Lingula anatina]
MQTCCGCWNLLQGSRASGIWTLVAGILNLLWYIYQAASNTRSSISWNTFLGIALLVIWIITSIILLVGLSQSNRYMFLPWLIVTGLICLFQLITLIYFIIVAIVAPIFWITVVIAAIILALNIYAMVCVSFYYQQLVDGGVQPKV